MTPITGDPAADLALYAATAAAIVAIVVALVTGDQR